MNKIQYVFWGLTISILFLAVPIFAADWGSVTRLTFTSVTSNCSNDRCIDDSKNTDGLWLHAVYEDCIDNNYEIFYSVYSAWLGNWSNMQRLTSDDDCNSRYPSISCANNYVHVVWHDDAYGDNEICYRRCVYADQVWTWGFTTRLSTDNNSASEYPAVKENNGYVHVVWTDKRDGSNVPQIYYIRSANNGTNWGAETRLTTHNAAHFYPAVASSGNNVYVFWQDYYDGNYEIWYCKSTDNGVNFGNETRLTTDDNYNTYDPSVDADGGSNVYVTYTDIRNGNADVYLKRSTDAGSTWENEQQMTSGDYYQQNSCVACSTADKLFILWDDNQLSEIYSKFSTDNGATWGRPQRLTDCSGNSIMPSGVYTGGYAWIVWQDARLASQYDIYSSRGALTRGKGGQQRSENITNVLPSKTHTLVNNTSVNNSSVELNFEIDNTAPLRLLLYDICGREVSRCTYLPSSKNVTYYWNIGNLPNGIYFAEISQNNKTLHHSKVCWIK